MFCIIYLRRLVCDCVWVEELPPPLHCNNNNIIQYTSREVYNKEYYAVIKSVAAPARHSRRTKSLAFYRISLFQRRGALLNTTPTGRRSSFASVSITHRRRSSCRRLVLRACFAWQLPEPRLHTPRGHVLAHVFGAEWTDVK